MNNNQPVFDICPVPQEQQPINQYQELQESNFFSWGKSPLNKYLKKLTWIYLISWLITGPVAAASFPPGKQLAQFLLSATGGGLIFLLLTTTRMYLGWNYIQNRLNSETISYEESGWYDGQVWKKTPEILTRDRLLVSYEITPIIRRLQLTFLAIFLTFLGGIIIWQFNPSFH